MKTWALKGKFLLKAIKDINEFEDVDDSKIPELCGYTTSDDLRLALKDAKKKSTDTCDTDYYIVNDFLAETLETGACVYMKESTYETLYKGEGRLRKGDFEEVDEQHKQTYGLEDSFDEPMMYWDIDFMRYVDGEVVDNDDILELAGIKKEWLDQEESYAYL